jgi:HD-like signal output (HDOD) protein/AmiR/NasT family two-component response regulator
MVSLMLVTENQREMQILKTAFEQRGVKTVCSKAEYHNYVKCLQYLPDVILIEMPRPHMQQLHFIELIKNHKKIRQIPVIAYGDAMDAAEKNGILKAGAFSFFERPLKFSLLMNSIETVLKRFNKTIEVKPQVLDKEKDIQLLLASETPPMKKIEIMASHVSQILAFPFTVAKVLSLAESVKSAAADLARVIEADMVLSAQILKLSNSVLFASLNRRISSIKDAIVRIGFKETKRLVMGMSVMNLFDRQNKNLGFDRMGFWYHSLACGIIAERLARRVGTIDPEEAFLAGLLHDFGIILLDEFFPTLLSQIMEDTTSSGGLFIERERALLTITHNDVAGELFTKWKLPDLVRQGIMQQYSVDSFKDAVDSPDKKIAVCVAMGNMLAKTLLLGKECDQYVTPLDNAFFTVVKMQSGFTKTFLEDVYNELNMYREFLKLDFPPAQAPSEGVFGSDKKRLGIINQAGGVFVPPLVYFQKQGFNVNLMIHSGALSKYDNAFDVVLVWADGATTPDTLGQFTHIVKYSETAAAPGSPVAFVPLLVVLPAGNLEPFRNAGVEHASYACNAIDLRQLDRNISSILLGTPVAFPDAQELLAAKANSGRPPVEKSGQNPDTGTVGQDGAVGQEKKETTEAKNARKD